MSQAKTTSTIDCYTTMTQPLIQIRHFAPTGQPLRTFDAAGEPWFIAKDVCDVLGLSNRAQAMAGLDGDEKGVITADTPGGRQKVLTVNESGFYALVLRSRKPMAKAFRKWVTSAVLPAIRRDGGYIRGEELLNVNCLTLRQLEDREVLLNSAIAATQTRKLQRLRRIEERDARASGFQALQRRN